MAGGYSQDVLTGIINVHWGSNGGFSFAGSIIFNVLKPPSEGVIGQNTPHFTWLGGASTDGKQWQSAKREEGLFFFCCVGGDVDDKFIVVAAGVLLSGPHDFGPGYSIAWGEVPAAGVSYNGGLTWQDAGLPKQDFVLRPPNPITGQAGHFARGNAQAVAFDPVTKTFYIGATIFFNGYPDLHYEDRMYSSNTGTAFSQVYSERRGLSTPFPGYKWPESEVGPEGQDNRLRVADRTLKTKSGPGVLFVVSFDESQRAEYVTIDDEGMSLTSYLSVKKDGAVGVGVLLGEKEISPPMAVVNSVCGGKGHIVAVGWEDEDENTGPITFVSNDEGKTWTPQLSDLSTKNPEDDDELHSGSSDGSCSFSVTKIKESSRR